jgi:hypothetical protein
MLIDSRLKAIYDDSGSGDAEQQALTDQFTASLGPVAPRTCSTASAR